MLPAPSLRQGEHINPLRLRRVRLPFHSRPLSCRTKVLQAWPRGEGQVLSPINLEDRRNPLGPAGITFTQSIFPVSLS